ncbi:MAG: D-tyrosyl-tRNA(Tyr) deacylase, partial [Gammaproteobacteria bacterium]|nr:D-tyrosyl-tRNA(Tyr) deacylase [Gammaproteobacteria bacterium]
NRSVLDVGGAILVVSQFTLAGDLSRGKRPSFGSAAPADQAERLVEAYAAGLRGVCADVKTGRFGAHMRVALVNDGPATFLLER